MATLVEIANAAENYSNYTVISSTDDQQVVVVTIYPPKDHYNEYGINISIVEGNVELSANAYKEGSFCGNITADEIVSRAIELLGRIEVRRNP